MMELLKNLISGIRDNQQKKDQIDKIYKIHKYWARKPWYVIDEYIGKYSQKGDLVLDPFCGSGLIGCEAISFERDFLGIDLNPMSIMISEGTMKHDVDLASLSADFDTINKQCKEKIISLSSLDIVCPH